MNKDRTSEKVRCGWVTGGSELDIAYHDREWGTPLHDDQKLFEFLTLEGAQAGLSWSMILKKRENYRVAFDNFDPAVVAKYGADDTARLLADAGIVRNRLKIASVVINAQKFLDIQREFGSFDKYIWQFVGGKPKINSHKWMKEIPAKTAESDAMSKDLKKRGFKFIGTTICYAFMQATGMVNDHEIECFRYKQV